MEQGDDVYQRDLSTYARLLKQAEVAAIEVSHYDFAQKGHCYNEDRALLVKRESGLPVMVVGGYHTCLLYTSSSTTRICAAKISPPFYLSICSLPYHSPSVSEETLTF